MIGVVARVFVTSILIHAAGVRERKAAQATSQQTDENSWGHKQARSLLLFACRQSAAHRPFPLSH
jgi:hypothetical protein